MSEVVEIDPDVGQRTAGVAGSIMFGRIVALLLSGIAFIIVARILGPGRYGVFTVAVAFATFFSSFSDLGVATSFNKFIGEHRAKKDNEAISRLFANGITIILITAITLTAIALIFSGPLAKYVLGDVSYTPIIQISSLIIILGILFSASYSSIIGFGRQKYIYALLILQIGIQSALSILLVYMGWGITAPIFGMLSGYVAGIAFTVFLIRYRFGIKLGKPSLGEMSKLLKFSIPISIYSGLRGLVNSLAPIILALFVTTAIVGNYGVALKTSNLFILVIEAFTSALLPAFASTLSMKNVGKRVGQLYNNAIYFTFLFMIPAMLFVTLMAKPISYTAFSAKYTIAPSYLSIIAIGTLFWVIATYTIMLLIGRNMVQDLLKLSVIVAIMEFILIAVLIPIFKGYGLVVLLNIISPIIMSSLAVMFVKKRLDIALDAKRLLRLTIAGIMSAVLLAPLIYFMHNYILLLVAGAAEQILVYPVLVGLMAAISKKELSDLEETSQSLPVINYLISLMVKYCGAFVKA